MVWCGVMVCSPFFNLRYEEEEVAFLPLTNESFREAVRLWRRNQAHASEKYNHINKWNTSQVTDMSELFELAITSMTASVSGMCLM